MSLVIGAALAAFTFVDPAALAAARELPTVAEKSGYVETATHRQVMEFCQQLAKRSPGTIRLSEMGTTGEGKSIPLLIVADPPVSTAEEARASGKSVFFAIGDIHAGEVCGKEALCMLARDIAAAGSPALKDWVLVFAPIFNGDGNDRMNKFNRPGQVGPAIMGTRANAGGYDLNRDFIKLETPEVRALVRAVNRWNPAVFVDTHTTNGSYHRYTITYDSLRHPACDRPLAAFANDMMLPKVGEAMRKATGYDSFFYGDFVKNHTQWESYPPQPRYGIQYLALRNCIPVLSEAYSYAPYKDRVLATFAFVRELIEYSTRERDAIRMLTRAAEKHVVSLGANPHPDNLTPLRYVAAKRGPSAPVKGFVETMKNGRPASTGEPKDYVVDRMLDSKATLAVSRPYAYLIPATFVNVKENLQRHGIAVEELREDVELDLEAYTIDGVERERREFQRHKQVKVQATSRPSARKIEAGTLVVKTAQPLGTLVVTLLEPMSDDGLTTWNFFDEALTSSKEFPVLRMPRPMPLTTTAARPLPEDRRMNRPITAEYVYEQNHSYLDGDPVTDLMWIDDEHFLQAKEDRFVSVHAISGRVQESAGGNALEEALAKLPTITPERARTLARSAAGARPSGPRGRRGFGAPRMEVNASRTAVLFDVDNDLYFASLDGKVAVRLTSTPAKEELAQFSPDGKFVAFVRDQNLYVVDVATKTERALTTDGGGPVSNGKADWVYYEEIYDRNWKGFWWSPDSRRIAFLRYDDTPVPNFTVINDLPVHQLHEVARYPKVGDANPKARLGLAPVAGGAIEWLDVPSDADRALIISRVGWNPQGECYFTVQNRTQTYLDLYFAAPGSSPRKLLRETTKAWVNYDTTPTFLKDGSFLLPSERTGYKHLYHYTKRGELKKQITSGDWEVRSVENVDEAKGLVYFRGMKDNPIGAALYKVRLDGTGLEKVTRSTGDRNRIQFNPSGSLYVDTWSDRSGPTRVTLCYADGSTARRLDINPVHELEELAFAPSEMVKIPMKDGFVLEGGILRPKNFDPTKKYPVWFQTYAGPHMPTITDNWAGGRMGDQALASAGFVVFACDPRSASGKGAVSAWAAYKRLGVQELKDIEEAIQWLVANHPYCDASRIGMEGTSYGGYMTSYCLTHSKLFAAGIAGAPVTDWHNYDSFYTERYMDTPAENPEGYASGSVVTAAANLHGRLLLVHGMMDDNVHPQNSLQLAHALQRANKPFEMMVYPTSRHGGFGQHYNMMRMEFIKRTLGSPPAK